MFRWKLWWIGLALALLASAQTWAASDRAALVIGNASYEVGRLTNPVNDANDVAAALRKLDFDVTLGIDLGREEMLRTLETFRRDIKPGGLALVFYAGHAVEVDGQNWLLPVRNRAIGTQADVPIYSVSAQDILRKIEEGGARLNLLVLDACRDNPLPAGSRSTSRGLGTIAAGGSTLVAYSTAPGKTAADGSGRNSPYAAALVAALSQERVSVTDLFNQVGADVMRRTGGSQVPWNSNTPIWPPILLAGGAVVIQQPQQGSTESRKGELQITVAPSAAQVYVNGYLMGSGNQTVDWASGEGVTVTAKAPGYAEFSEKVLIRSGQVSVVRLSLSALPPTSGQTASPSTVPPSANAGLSPTRSAIEPEMVRVQAGRFKQGSPSHEEGRGEAEGPVHTVSIKAFGLGKHEVTRGEFRRFVEASGYRTDAEKNTPTSSRVDELGCFAYKGGMDLGWKAGTSWRDPGFPQDDSRPVVCVSHSDAQAYIEWLRRETGRPYRLPTESELEYANRAGTTTPWPWGTDGNAGCGVANYADATAKSRFSEAVTATCSDGHVFTAPVGSFRANAFGLRDTAGNVLEWTQDCLNDTYKGAPGDGSAWMIGDCDWRVLRGGGWDYDPRLMRAAARSGDSSANRDGSVGFRLAQDYLSGPG